MEEVWKDISGYEGLYQVSDLGRIRSLERVVMFGKNYCASYVNPEKLMGLSLSKKGYYYVAMSSNGAVVHKSVHRIVAMAHIHNSDNKPEVNHKNGIKTDNRVINLEWVTSLENSRHSWNVLGRKTPESACKKMVLHVSLDGFIKNVFMSLTDAANELGVGVPAVCNAMRRRSVFLKESYLI